MRLRLKAVCVASIVISISFLYATSHGVGPFYSKADTNLLDLNVFLIGISLIGQFLAVLFQQLEERRQALVAKNLDTQLASQGAGIGFWQRDIKTGNEIWDAQMLKIYGLQPEQFDGNWEKRVHPEDLHRTNEYLTQAERDLRRFETEYRIVTPAGEVRWVKGMGSNVADAHGKPWKTYGIEYDITESRRAQAELAAAKERELTLEKEQREEITRKLKTSLAAAGIAHEINQPLSQILLQTELSLRNLAKKPGQDPENAEAFRLIQGRAEQVVGTIETIRALLGNVASDHQPLNLTDVVRSAALYLQPALQRAGVELRTEGLEATHTITGDDAQLHLLVSNLVRNAIQAVESQPTDRRKISISLAETPGGLTLNMEDSGPGFTEEQKLRSEMPIESTKPEGMGMGLFLARTAAENHRASITFSRSPTLGGASVTVTFPK